MCSIEISPTSLSVQTRRVGGGDTDRFKQAGKAVILRPARYKSAELQVPFGAAGSPAPRAQHCLKILSSLSQISNTFLDGTRLRSRMSRLSNLLSLLSKTGRPPCG